MTVHPEATGTLATPVMAGLDPAIHAFRSAAEPVMDPRPGRA